MEMVGLEFCWVELQEGGGSVEALGHSVPCVHSSLWEGEGWDHLQQVVVVHQALVYTHNQVCQWLDLHKEQGGRTKGKGWMQGQ